MAGEIILGVVIAIEIVAGLALVAAAARRR
jgi:hypothetical protein